MSSLVTDVTEPLPLVGEMSRKTRLKRVWRLVTVLTRMEIKLRYGDSALGYVWTIGKPMALFLILYVVFGRLVRFGAPVDHYSLYLVIGVMLWAFFADGVSLVMNSLVSNGTLLRKLPFPRLVIPLSASLTSFITFGLSIFAIAIFVAVNGLIPQLTWFVLILEVIELYLFVLGLGLILAVVYARLRDVAQVWELALQLLFFLSPIVYPFSMVPARIRQIMLLNPFTQVMQDVRAIIIYPDPHGGSCQGLTRETCETIIVAPAAFSPLRLLPLLAVACTIGLGLWMFKREEPWLPERV